MLFQKKKWMWELFLLLFFGILSNESKAATYYVDLQLTNDCSQGNYSKALRNCSGSDGKAWNTINEGLTNMVAGDTLYLRQGDYGSQGVDQNNGFVPSGNSSNPVIISAYLKEVVTIRRVGLNGGVQFLTVENLIIDAAKATDQPLYIGHGIHDIRIKNCDMKNGIWQGVMMGDNTTYNIELLDCAVHDNLNSHGIYNDARNVTIDGCDIYNNGKYGIHTYNGNTGQTSDNNIYRNNRVHNNGFNAPGLTPAGILLSSGSGNVAYNNLVYNEPFVGIQVGFGPSGSNNRVENNTVYNIGNGSGTGIEVRSGFSGTVVKNNILFLTSGFIDSGAGTSKSNNLTADPKFVNASALDFRLQSGSPAIDAGVTLSEVVCKFGEDAFGNDILKPCDFDKNPRPQGSAYDIGAYEFTSATQATRPNAPANLRVN